MIFDTHTHYDDDSFDEDRDELIGSLPEHGIGAVTAVAASVGSCQVVQDLARKYDFFYAAVGVHPDDVGGLTEEILEKIEDDAVRNPKVVAIGEIGLDYHWDIAPREVQKYWFRRQLAAARRTGLPFIIHSRDASQDTFDLLVEERAEELGGVLHSYSGSVEMAKEYVKRGYYLGVGGVVTFKNAKTIKEVVKAVGPEHLVLETDCPYLTPVPFRGKRNSSLYLPYVVDTISGLTGKEPEEVEEITWRNARKLFRLE